MKTITGSPAQHARRNWLRDNLMTKCRYNADFTKPKGNTALSLPDIARIMTLDLGGQPVTSETVRRDIRYLQAEYVRRTAAKFGGEPVTDRLLLAENFAEWRAQCFRTPTDNMPYETPKHQLAWFYIVSASATAFRADPVIIPEWVLSYLGFPEDLNDKLADPKQLISIFLLGPPRHGKTEIALHIMLWLICRYPDIRMMFCNGLRATTITQLDYIRDHLENNTELVKNWGPFRDESCKWSQLELEVKGADTRSKARTLFGFASDGNILSRDADVIFLDDPQGPAEAMSELNTDKVYHWMRSGVMTRREPHTAFIGLGSHQPAITGDLWRRVEDDIDKISVGAHTVLMAKLPAHDYRQCPVPVRKEVDGVMIEEPITHEQCILWPSYRPYEFLESLRSLMGDDDLFEAVFNQQPYNQDTDVFPPHVFKNEFYLPLYSEDLNRCPPYQSTPIIWPDGVKHEWLPGVLDQNRSWREPPPECCKVPHMWAVGVDPASGQANDRGSFNALIMRTMCPKCTRTYYVDYGERRMSPDLIPDWIGSYTEQFSPKIDTIRIEANAFQKALTRNRDLRDIANRQQFQIEEWRTDERRNDSLMGVPSIARPMRNGMSSIPYKHPEDRNKADHLIRAYKRWPGLPNDLPMADWLCHLSLTNLVEKFDRRSEGTQFPRFMPGHDLSPFDRLSVRQASRPNPYEQVEDYFRL